jgi:hypothetical protein
MIGGSERPENNRQNSEDKNVKTEILKSFMDKQEWKDTKICSKARTAFNGKMVEIINHGAGRYQPVMTVTALTTYAPSRQCENWDKAKEYAWDCFSDELRKESPSRQ